MSRLFVAQEMTQHINRAQRLIALRDVLAEPVWRSAADLAERFGVTTRTMQRDLGALEALGYALEVVQGEGTGNQPRYRLMKRSRSDAA